MKKMKNQEINANKIKAILLIKGLSCTIILPKVFYRKLKKCKSGQIIILHVKRFIFQSCPVLLSSYDLSSGQQQTVRKGKQNENTAEYSSAFFRISTAISNHIKQRIKGGKDICKRYLFYFGILTILWGDSQ